jgi:hypothetical protein
MAWKKGESGNLQGRPRKTDVRTLCTRGSKVAIKILREYIEGKRECSDADRLKAIFYILDRTEAKPAADESGGMFQGAQIVVHTGFQDAPPAITAPTIDVTPVNGTGYDAEHDDEDEGIE